MSVVGNEKTNMNTETTENRKKILSDFELFENVKIGI